MNDPLKHVRLLLEPLTRALVLESPHTDLDTHLNDLGMKTTRVDKILSEEMLIDASKQTKAQVLFKRSRVPITRKVIEACPDLHAIQLCCIGDDSIDKVACADHGVLVFNDPVSNGRSVVELAIGHLIALSRRLYETDQRMHQNQWEKYAFQRYEIKGKHLGFVGLGNIARRTARLCEELGMHISFYDNRPVAQEVGSEMGWTFFSTLEELFANSDMVTVHTSAMDYLGNNNEALLDPYLEYLGRERGENSPRIFLNLARGNLHSHGALLDAVKKKQIMRAAVDVYGKEPAPGESSWNNPYIDEPRIICTPHIGGATAEAQPRIARRVSATIKGFSRYGCLRDCVFSPRSKLSVKDRSQGHTVLAVVHSTSRGTKKAVDDAIFQAEVSNLRSAHRDFPNGIAYDLSLLERPLSKKEIETLIESASKIANETTAIRALRQIQIPLAGW